LKAKEGKVVDTEDTIEGRVHKLLQEALKPEEPKEKAEVKEAPAEETKPVLPKEESTGYTPKEENIVKAGEEGREPAKSAEEYHPVVQQKISELSDDNLRKLAKAHGLEPNEYDFNKRDERRHRIERDQLANEITQQLNEDEKINIGRAAEQAEREPGFENRDRSAKANAERAAKLFPRLRVAVDQFGNPKVSGGSPTAAAAPAKVENRATERRIDEGKSPTGEERRTAERRASLRSPIELEKALKRGEPVKTPFDVTEGANETISKDKMMPLHPAEETKTTDATKHTYEYNKTGDIHQVTARDPEGDSVALVSATSEEEDPRTWTVRSSYSSKVGKGIGERAYMRLAEAARSEANRTGKPITLQGDKEMSPAAKRTWEKLETNRGYPVQWKEGHPYINFEPEEE
jgi:hypothetical protein